MNQVGYLEAGAAVVAVDETAAAADRIAGAALLA